MRNALVSFAVVCAATWLAVTARYRLPTYTPLSDAEGRALVARARAGAKFAVPARLDRDAVFARQWSGRMKVDVVVGRAPISRLHEALFAVSLVPGVDGIGVTLDDGKEAWLLPDELLAADVLARGQPLAALDFELGLNAEKVDRLLARALGIDELAFARAGRRYFRFRVDSFIESADHAGVVRVIRGNTPGPALTKEALRKAAIAGGKYLVRHLYDDGRFGYEYTPGDDKDEAYALDYSLPRHAGGIYFLAQLYHRVGDEAFADAAARALAFLARLPPCGRGERACVAAKEGLVDLGTTAMTLTAVVEHAAATGSKEHLAWARRLANFVLFMQKDDGDFCHLYERAGDKRDEKTKMLYFSGEAALALAKLAVFIGPGDRDYPRLVAALDRALEYLTDKQYAFLAGQFYFGEDHWTCIAADTGWALLPPAHRERYARFCDQFAAFLRRTQFDADDPVVRAQPDFLGAYGFSPLLPPHPTPVGSRTEATLSTYAMDQRRGRPSEATLAQIRLGLSFLLAHQIRDDSAYLMANPDAARGGFLMSDVKRYVRIDFIQHACSAMLRAIDIL